MGLFKNSEIFNAPDINDHGSILFVFTVTNH